MGTGGSFLGGKVVRS